MNAATETAAQTRGQTAIAIKDDQSEFDSKQIAALEQLGVGTASRADLAIFFHQAVRTGLDPFAKQIYMIQRQGKQTIQTGIDGFRLVARRAAARGHEPITYSDTLWCGEDGKWVDVWLGGTTPPMAAKVIISRNGEPFSGVAVFSEYVGRKGDGSVNAMWTTKPSHMIAKCAEALALRKAFPQELSGLYTDDEMAQADYSEQSQDPATPSPRSGLDRLRAAVTVIDEHPTEPEPMGIDRFAPGGPECVNTETGEITEPETVGAEVVEPTAEDIAAINAESQADAPDTTAPSAKFGGPES